MAQLRLQSFSVLSPPSPQPVFAGESPGCSGQLPILPVPFPCTRLFWRERNVVSYFGNFNCIPNKTHSRPTGAVVAVTHPTPQHRQTPTPTHTQAWHSQNSGHCLALPMPKAPHPSAAAAARAQKCTLILPSAGSFAHLTVMGTRRAIQT